MLSNFEESIVNVSHSPAGWLGTSSPISAAVKELKEIQAEGSGLLKGSPGFHERHQLVPQRLVRQ